MSGKAMFRELGIFAAIQAVILFCGTLAVLMVPLGRTPMESPLLLPRAVGPLPSAVVIDESAVAGADAVISITDLLKFEPASVTIEVGEVVAWQNTSLLRHTATADPTKAANPSSVILPPQAQPFDSGYIEPGEVYQRTFDVPGTYRYFCIPHEATGMTGEIVVEAP